MSDIFDKEENSTGVNSAQKQTEFNYSYDQSREPIGSASTEASTGFFANITNKIKAFMNNQNTPQNTTDSVDEACPKKSCAFRRKVAAFFSGANAKTKRIIFFVILLIIILLLILWLKSSNNKTVESFEDGNMQFQAFQPIDNVDPNPSNFEGAENKAKEPENKIISIDSNQSANDAYTVNGTKNNAIVVEETNPVATPAPEVVAATDSKALAKAKSIIQADALKQKQEQAAKAKAQPKVSQKTEKSVAATAKKAPVKAHTTTKGNAKVVTIKKGMSLMQAFRNHGLNVKDLNAMVHTANSGKALNHFQPGDQVRVTTDKNGHVETLTLKTGSSFIRQTNGSYIFLK